MSLRRACAAVRLGFIRAKEAPACGDVSKQLLSKLRFSTSAVAPHQHLVQHGLARQGGAAASSWGVKPAAAFGLAGSILALGVACGGTERSGIVSAILSASLLNGAILVHEAGHLAAARAFGVAVREFSVGIGPRVAWWQGATTTYTLRALPLFGYVSFLTAAHLAANPHAAGAPAPAAQQPYPPTSHAGWHQHMRAVQHRATAVPRAAQRPLVLLEALPAGRRAVVTLAGVAANVLLAAGFVAWQVARYGELGVVVRPGARVHVAEGGEGAELSWAQLAERAASEAGASTSGGAGGAAAGGAQQGQRGSARAAGQVLRAGDVVLRVGGVDLPAGGDQNAAIVGALGLCSSGGGAADLGGARMTVLRAHPAAGGEQGPAGGGGGAVVAGGAEGRKELLVMPALQLLSFDTLVVGPNNTAGYRAPADAAEALAMTGRELLSWGRVVVSSWGEALGAAAAFGSSDAAATSNSTSGAAAGGGSQQLVGPLGIVASAAAAAVAADRETRAPHCYCEAEAAAGGGAGGSGTAAAGGSDEVAAALWQHGGAARPPPLLDLGIQLNLQLALVNLLPVPVLDGGQLVLLALEAARGGRRLPPSVERWALLGSGLLVAGWAVALSVWDLVGLLDAAAGRMGVLAAPHYALQQQQQGDGPQQQQAAPVPGRMQVAVGVSGPLRGAAAGGGRQAEREAALTAPGSWAM